MLEELISKKELLELMEISYGQLYRWKRKNLIPEEWFICLLYTSDAADEEFAV